MSGVQHLEGRGWGSWGEGGGACSGVAYLEGVGGEERPDLGDNGAAHATKHYSVTLMQDTINQDHINGGAQALNDLHLQHGALSLTDDHQP